MAAKRTAKKTAKQSAGPAPAKIPQARGGALSAGGTPGNKGGTGRPPSFLRDKLRESYGERMAFLDRVIDGEALQRIEVGLLPLIPHLTCANCGESQIQPKEPTDALFLSFEAKASASVKDRLAALEHQAKYGIGALKEISVENVRGRVAETLAIIRAHCSSEQGEAIILALRPVWA